MSINFFMMLKEKKGVLIFRYYHIKQSIMKDTYSTSYELDTKNVSRETFLAVFYFRIDKSMI